LRTTSIRFSWLNGKLQGIDRILAVSCQATGAILECVGLDGLPAVEAACQEALDQGVFSAAVIINILARKRDPQPAAILSIPDALRLTHEPLADCARYDSLRRAS
jgi:hypothetical protein